MSRNQSIRLRIIDELIRNPYRHYGRKELLDALNAKLLAENRTPIAMRQLQKDLNFIQDDASGYAAPLEYNRKKGYYEYTEAGYSMQEKPVKASDLATLHQAVAILRQFAGLGYGEELAGILERLETQAARQLSPPVSVLKFEQVSLKGLELLHRLHRAILDEQSIEVHYRPYNQAEANHWLLHPYYLKEYNHRWFLFGLEQESQFVMTLALDRIEHLAIAQVPYVYNTEIDFEQRFRYVLGVTIPAELHEKFPKPERIHLRFSPSRGQYVKTKPIHSTQQIVLDTEDGLELSLELIINPELISKVLSFGATVEVLAPFVLRQEVEMQLKKSLKLMQGISRQGIFLDVPVRRQAVDSTDCGPVCVQMLLEYLGKPMSLEAIKREIALFGPEQYTYAPQIGLFLLKQGLKVRMEIINPQLFAWEEQGIGMIKITQRILELYEEAKREKKAYRQQVLQFFIDFIDAGGHIDVHAPEVHRIAASLQKGYPILAILATHHFSPDSPRTVNSHAQLIRGIDPSHIYVNDPSWVEQRGGRRQHLHDAYFYGLAANVAMDMDNGALLYVEA